ncbi:MAG: purine-binding chemotaxis protein CheW [Myxococcaceae bacterium]|nr:purine-binding chemotaxis protein CheW [Myxococcaceae bacterium]
MPRFEELLEDFFYRPEEDVGALFDAGGIIEAPAAAAVEESPEEYLAFRLADETYAVRIGVVREIVKVPPLTEVPRSSAELLGVINLRGEVLPVYDLKLRLRLSTVPAPIAGPDANLAALPKSARILIVHDPEGDAGVLVDAVLEVVKLRPSTLEAPPRAVSGGDRSPITGIGRRREQLFILLDLAQALP